MDFKLLGPFEASGDRVASLGGPTQRAVLAMLALAAPEVVSADRLVDGLWGENPPAKPLATLQVFVHRLRHALREAGDHAGLLESRPPGYRLAVEVMDSDVGRFHDLLKRARRSRDAGEIDSAHAQLVEALSCWRGPALSDLQGFAFAQAESVRLDEQRLQALEERLELAMTLGLHADCVAELEDLVRSHPTRETFWGQLMVALYRCDRQADALLVYGRARDMLAEELGIDPGQALQQLEVAILRQDPSLAGPDRPPVLAAAKAPGGGDLRPRARGAIPPVVTATFGREELVAEVVDTLSRGGARLVSLTGMGGTGKSRVALVAARRLLEAGERVCFLPVNEATTPRQLIAETALAFGFSDGDDPLEWLADLPGAGVVVWDNLEAMPERIEAVLSILERTSLTLLVTSRSPVDLSVEQDVPIPPLPVPDEFAGMEQVAESPAVALFVSRAVAARRSFRLEGNEAAVAELCRFVDGLPLALELAAARLKVLDLDRLMVSLGSSLGVLTTEASDVPERHRTLERTILWSYDRLDEPTQLLCDRLALFERGFTLEVLEAVCADVPDVLDRVAAIADARLIRVAESRIGVRFVMMGTVRAWVRIRLADRPDVAARRRALAEHLTASMRQWGDELDGPDGMLAQARFDDASADVDASLDWAIETGDVSLAATLAVLATPLWIASGRAVDGLRRTQLASARAGEGDPLDLAPLRLVELLVATGQLAYSLTDWDLAREACSQALALAPGLPDGGADVPAANARCYLAGALAMTGDPGGAAGLAAESLAVAEQCRIYPLTAVVLSVLAIASAVQGDFEAERQAYQRRLEVVRSHGDVTRTADTLNVLAEIALDDADSETATVYAGEALALAGPVRLPEARDALITLARAAIAAGELAEAAGFVREALILSDRTGQRLALAQCMRTGAGIAALRHDDSTSVRLFAAAQTVCASPDGTDDPIEADFRAWLAGARTALGDVAARREWTLGTAVPAQSARRLLDGVVVAAG